MYAYKLQQRSKVQSLKVEYSVTRLKQRASRHTWGQTCRSETPQRSHHQPGYEEFLITQPTEYIEWTSMMFSLNRDHRDNITSTTCLRTDAELWKGKVFLCFCLSGKATSTLSQSIVGHYCTTRSFLTWREIPSCFRSIRWINMEKSMSTDMLLALWACRYRFLQSD